jgi:hypothetical protein
MDVPVEIYKNLSNALESTPVSTEVKVKPSRASHKRYASNVDCKVASSKQMPNTSSFKECRSDTNLESHNQPSTSRKVEIASPTHKRMLSKTLSIDPITQDVERRMSSESFIETCQCNDIIIVKDHHSTMGSSSRSDDASRDQSLHSLHNSFDHARTMFRSYSTVAQGFLRGAYQKARNIVTSRYSLKGNIKSIIFKFIVAPQNVVRWSEKMMKGWRVMLLRLLSQFRPVKTIFEAIVDLEMDIQ